MSAGKAMVGEPDNVNPNVAKKTIDVTVAMFFDGTGNNMYNTDEADKQSDIYKKNTDHGTSSYENSYSNVARLYLNYDFKKYPNHFRLYLDGIGTLKWQKDDMLDGTALGRYEHGIVSRVKEGCKKMADTLSNAISSKVKVIETLTVDVFGFSRGAAAARHFLFEIGREAYKSTQHTVSGASGMADAGYSFIFYKDKMGNETEFKEFPKRGYLGAYCQQNNIQINRVNFRFAGLFETVASYSENIMFASVFDARPISTPKAFTNDTAELGLDAIKLAKRVVHLTAGDEIRANFPLTNITSAGSRGTQLFFPGVHSDVGGCYHDNRDEHIERLMQMDITTLSVTEELLGLEAKFPEEEARLIKEGWYTKGELHRYDVRYGGGIASLQRCLSGKRQNLRNSYSFIPLYIMCQFAVDFDKDYNPIPFDLTKLESRDTKTFIQDDPLLLRIKDRLWDYAFNNGGPVELEFTKVAKVEEPRQPYTSMPDASYVKSRSMIPLDQHSQNDKDLMELRHRYLHISANYDRAAGMIIPNYPRIKDGHKKRLELPG